MKRGDPDPLDVQAGVPPALRMKRLHPAVVREHREIYVRGYIAGLGSPYRRPPRRVWIAIVLATTALVLTAFWAGHTSAAPRSAPQQGAGTTLIASLSAMGEASEERTGAPSTSEPSRPPAPQPSGGIGEPASYCKPGYCETPAPRPQIVSYGTAGQATWWNSFGSGYYAAIRPDLGSKGDLAVVCGGSPFHCRTVEVITTCACLGPNSDRLIDLSLDTFVDFAPPGFWPGTTKPRTPGWQGTIRITLQVVR